MREKVEVSVEEVKSLFVLLEDLNTFFHQPMHYEDAEQVKSFMLAGAYRRIADMYYHVVWNWLPPDVREHFESL